MKTTLGSRTSLFRGIPALAVSGALLLATIGVGAAEKSRTLTLPKGPITSLDFTNMTFTVTVEGTNLTVFITSDSRFFKDGKYAISRDFKPGDVVRGTMKIGEEGRHEAVRVYSGKSNKGK